jgi:hypothetical protein
LNFKYAFISRDSSQNAIKHYLKKMKDVVWNHESNKYRVCDGPVSCCQLISWTPLCINSKIDMEPCND